MAKILIFLQPDHERSMSVLREEPNWVTASKMQLTFWRIVSWLLRYISITANKTLKPLKQRATYNAQTKCILILVTLYCIDGLELGSAGVRSMCMCIESIESLNSGLCLWPQKILNVRQRGLSWSGHWQGAATGIEIPGHQEEVLCVMWTGLDTRDANQSA